MKTAGVQEFCRNLWAWREGFFARECCAARLSRRLARVVARDVEARISYDPERDCRVMWAREVIAALRARPERKPMASPDLEATAMWLLDMIPEPQGRALAAGE